MMNPANLRHSSLALSLITFSLLIFGKALAAGPLLIAYGGHNETMAPLYEAAPVLSEVTPIS